MGVGHTGIVRPYRCPRPIGKGYVSSLQLTYPGTDAPAKAAGDRP